MIEFFALLLASATIGLLVYLSRYDSQEISREDR